MNEETFGAFTRVIRSTLSVDPDANLDLITIGKSLGNSEEQLKEDFPELYAEEEDEDEEDEDDLDTDDLDDDIDDAKEDEADLDKETTI